MGYWGIATGVIGSTELADGGVAGVDIADGTITSAKLATEDYFGNNTQHFVMCTNLVTGNRITFTSSGTLILPTGGSNASKAIRYCNEAGALQWHNGDWQIIYGEGVNYFRMPTSYAPADCADGAMYWCGADQAIHVFNASTDAWEVICSC